MECLFDAISHAMSTVAIGGFSTHDESIGFFNSISIELICMTFMLLSAFSFALHYFALYKKRPLKYIFDPELRFFFSILLLIFLIALLISLFTNDVFIAIFQRIILSYCFDGFYNWFFNRGII